MSKPGPKPTPTILKELRGNPGKRPLPKNEPQPDISGACPKPPAYLPVGAKKIWKSEAPKLHRIGVLTDADIHGFSMCCIALWRHVEAEKMMQPRYNKRLKKQIEEAEKAAGEKLNIPLVGAVSKGQYSVFLNMSHRSMEMAMKFLDYFGMTPSSRGRIQVKSPKEKSPLEKFKARGAKLRAVK